MRLKWGYTDCIWVGKDGRSRNPTRFRLRALRRRVSSIWAAKYTGAHAMRADRTRFSARRMFSVGASAILLYRDSPSDSGELGPKSIKPTLSAKRAIDEKFETPERPTYLAALAEDPKTSRILTFRPLNILFAHRENPYVLRKSLTEETKITHLAGTLLTDKIRRRWGAIL